MVHELQIIQVMDFKYFVKKLVAWADSGRKRKTGVSGHCVQVLLVRVKSCIEWPEMPVFISDPNLLMLYSHTKSPF